MKIELKGIKMGWELGVLLFIIGGGLGTGATLFAKRDKSEPVQPTVIKDETSETQQEIIKQLTDLDLVKPVCDPVYVSENTNLLCRELFCRQTARGIDAVTSQSECENISNISNKIYIVDYCNQLHKPVQDVNGVVIEYTEEMNRKAEDNIDDCMNFFWKRGT